MAARTTFRQLGLMQLLLLLLAGAAIALGAADEPPVMNKMCPVMTDEAIDPEIYTDYQGRRIYFCCVKCRKKFGAEPEKYLALLDAPKITESTEAQTLDAGPISAKHSEHQQQLGAPTADHNHAASRAADRELTFINKLLRWSGKLHPLVVHFPIALIFAAALAEIIGLISRQEYCSSSARFCLALAALSAVAAASLGWLNANFSRHPVAETILFWHRWLGVSAAGLISVTWLSGEWLRWSATPVRRKIYLSLLIASCIVIGATGHFGAALVYGWDYLLTL